jgi:hypothetical protein
VAYAVLVENRDSDGVAEIDAILEGKASPKQAREQDKLRRLMGGAPPAGIVRAGERPPRPGARQRPGVAVQGGTDPRVGTGGSF